jgi:hypothetical protein
MRLKSFLAVSVTLGLAFLIVTGCPPPVSPGVTGALAVSVSWPASDVESPSITATLTPASGPSIPLDFSLSGNQGSFSSSSIPAGLSTLALQVQDNGALVEGVVELVRIGAGQSTSETVALAKPSPHGGKLRVNITPAMADPILVSVSGVPVTMSVGSEMTATATATGFTTGVTFVWYLDGASVGVDSSLTLGTTLAAGYYRLDVTGFTGDGTRAGSAAASFQVTAPPPS